MILSRMWTISYREEFVLPDCEMDTFNIVTWLILNFGNLHFRTKWITTDISKSGYKRFSWEKRDLLGWELRRFWKSKCSEIHITTQMISLGFKFWFNPVHATREISVPDVFVLWKSSERYVYHHQSTATTNSLNLPVNHQHALIISSNNNQKIKG